jgi:predicted phage tail component-like protein
MPIKVIFNNKNCYNDIGVMIESINIQPPSKKKIKQSVPFMNGSYDFSTVGSLGEIVYEGRIIKVKFILAEKNRALLYMKYTKVMEWLLGSGQSQLIFTDMPDCYYMAEVENAPSFEEVVRRAGKFDVEFIAEPFKTGVDYAGNNLWDPFNFEEDYMQDTEFDVIGSSLVTMYNPGRAVVPVINVDAVMTATIGGYTANLSIGDNIDYGFKLQPIENTINITGTGHIKILFRKVML